MINFRFFNTIRRVKYIKKICFIFILAIFLKFFNNALIKNELKNEDFNGIVTDSEYSFLVAGHTYGAIYHQNKGIYPKFLSRLQEEINHKDEFIFFTGDIVRNSTPESWGIVDKQLKKLSISSYLSMGNHDISLSGLSYFKKKHGNSYYYYRRGNDLFFSFNVNLSWGRITKEQVNLFKRALNEFESRNIFIFFHELIWTQGKLSYLHIRHNYIKYPFESNFWEDIYPILRSFPNRQFYLFAGDVGAGETSISAFYHKKQNVTFLASGMGNSKADNFMRVTVRKESSDIDLIPLNNEVSLGSITDYDLYDHFIKLFKNEKDYLFFIYIKKPLSRLKRAFFNILVKDHPG